MRQSGLLMLSLIAWGCAGAGSSPPPRPGDGGGGDGAAGQGGGEGPGPRTCPGSDSGATDGGGSFEWPVPVGPVTITPSPFWKNQLDLRRGPSDPFINRRTGRLGQITWVKFTVLTRDPTRVYFQDSVNLPLHYTFATRHLDPFVGMTPAQFEQVSLREARQEAITGAVLFPLRPEIDGIGVELARHDPYHPEMVKRVIDLVTKSILSEKPLRTFYFPTFEQAPCAEATSAWLAASGLQLGSVDRWSDGNNCYSPGWAFGKLAFVPGSEVAAAYADGRLRRQDILLTDRVPAEVPPVAGILSLRPSTPNSHAAILAQTLRTPFVHLAVASQGDQVKALDGREVVLVAGEHSLFPSHDLIDEAALACPVEVFALDPSLDPAVRADLVDLKAPAVLDIAAKAPLGRISKPADELTAADVRYFGGKAAGFGLLRRVVPNNSYPAIALSFDVWDELMAQPHQGRTLRDEIAARLAPFRSFPASNADLVALQAALRGVRGLIREQASFSPASQSAIKSALGAFRPFDPGRNLRFRSSTNVEDAADFSGAGLYDSYSGCLRDDLDADAAGPSACDPTEPEERGVFRAIAKVYASFYNDNAYHERVRHQVDENGVGMALLVHHSTPDPTELANGVGTAGMTRPGGLTYRLATQVGAQSVTNPSGESHPEVVVMFHGGSTVQPDPGSSLLPLGVTVMEPPDYRNLVEMMEAVRRQYLTTQPPGKVRHLLNFEYKKLLPNRKVYLKQVRELPLASTEPVLTPVLLNRPRRLCTVTKESDGALAAHRLKMRVAMETRSVRLTEAERSTSVHTALTVDYLEAGVVERLTGSPGGWPSASHLSSGTSIGDSWVVGTGPARRTVALTTDIPLKVGAAPSPIVTAHGLRFEVSARYDQPQPTFSGFGPRGTTSVEKVELHPCGEDWSPPEAYRRQQRDLRGAGGLVVRTSFFWAPNPRGGRLLKTDDLGRWEKTEIEGLTARPLVLTSEWAQTYKPHHHNFVEEFAFEPAADPSVTAEQRRELAARDVRLLVVAASNNTAPPTAPLIHVVGADNQVRAWR
jgi:hypothetical protein